MSELGQFHQFLLEVCLATCCSHSHSVMYNHLTTSSQDCTLHTAIAYMITTLKQLTCYTPSEFTQDSAVPKL